MNTLKNAFCFVLLPMTEAMKSPEEPECEESESIDRYGMTWIELKKEVLKNDWGFDWLSTEPLANYMSELEVCAFKEKIWRNSFSSDSVFRTNICEFVLVEGKIRWKFNDKLFERIDKIRDNDADVPIVAVVPQEKYFYAEGLFGDQIDSFKNTLLEKNIRIVEYDVMHYHYDDKEGLVEISEWFSGGEENIMNRIKRTINHDIVRAASRNFNVIVGDAFLIDDELFVNQQILKYRDGFAEAMRAGKLAYPLTFSEFSDFAKWKESQKIDKALLEADEILSMEDWEVELRYSMDAKLVKHERKIFLISEQNT